MNITSASVSFGGNKPQILVGGQPRTPVKMNILGKDMEVVPLGENTFARTKNKAGLWQVKIFKSDSASLVGVSACVCDGALRKVSGKNREEYFGIKHSPMQDITLRLDSRLVGGHLITQNSKPEAGGNSSVLRHGHSIDFHPVTKAATEPAAALVESADLDLEVYSEQSTEKSGEAALGRSGSTLAMPLEAGYNSDDGFTTADEGSEEEFGNAEMNLVGKPLSDQHASPTDDSETSGAKVRARGIYFHPLGDYDESPDLPGQSSDSSSSLTTTTTTTLVRSGSTIIHSVDTDSDIDTDTDTDTDSEAEMQQRLEDIATEFTEGLEIDDAMDFRASDTEDTDTDSDNAVA